MTAVVLDTDIGADIDDTWALALLLCCPELDLRLVTTVTGDTTYRARIAADRHLCGRSASWRALPEASRCSQPTRGRGRTPYWRYRSSILFDTVAVYLACDESLVNIERLPIAIDDAGVTRIAPGGAELRVAISWRDRERFEDLLVERLTRPDNGDG